MHIQKLFIPWTNLCRLYFQKPWGSIIWKMGINCHWSWSIILWSEAALDLCLAAVFRWPHTLLCHFPPSFLPELTKTELTWARNSARCSQYKPESVTPPSSKISQTVGENRYITYFCNILLRELLQKQAKDAKYIQKAWLGGEGVLGRVLNRIKSCREVE